MYQGSWGQRWNSLTDVQKIFAIVVGLLVLYWLATSNFLDPGRIMAMLLIIFVAFPVHEFAHAAMAVYLGDDTPKWQGRYTLNPIAHIEPFGALLLIFSGFGWAKPVQWNPRNINVDIRLGAILIAIAGPISNLVLAILMLTIGDVFFPTTGLLGALTGWFVSINVLLFVFNMLPIPPLDGSHILFALLPGDTFQLRATLSQYGFVILLLVIFLAPGIIRVPTQIVLGILFNLFG